VKDPARLLPSRLAQWWAYFQASGRRYGVDPYLLAAICDRESLGGEALKPKGPKGTGDGGHGLGLMQIDRRYHPDFAGRSAPTGLSLWCIPEWNIAYAASLLAEDLHAFGGDELRAVAAYNAGRAHVTRACAHLTRPFIPEALLAAVDSITTGGDYVSDVLSRRGKLTPPPEDIA
jgi:soluble lytic murein transglycosylase-like protein